MGAQVAGTPPLSDICGGSEMGRMVAAYDWASSSLGHPDTWCLELRTMVGICVNSRFPMLVVWGPDLVQIYNDGYRDMLDDKHPAALGLPVLQTWDEIADIIGPMFQSVIDTAIPTWEEDQLLSMERKGFPEEVYFSYSYSPIVVADGSVGGVLDVTTETTGTVLLRRRLACLAAITAAPGLAETSTEVAVRIVRRLTSWRSDIADVSIYLQVDGRPALISTNVRDDTARLRDAEFQLVLDEVIRSGEAVVVGDAPGRPSRLVVLPLARPGGVLVGAMVVGLSQRLLYDDGYAEFTQLLADAVAAALDVAHRYSVEIGEHRRISDTLQAAMLAPASDLPTVAARYVPASGNLAVGGDWYDVIALDGTRRALVVGDCVGHGLESAAAMSQLRSAARSMLYDGRGPADTIRGLNRYAESVDNAFCATVACLVIDRAEMTVTYARAGHLPPLVVHPGDDAAARWLDGCGGPPLAVAPDHPYDEAVAPLEHGDVMLLFSDGLVERRGETLDIGLRRLLDVVTAAPPSSVQQLADHVIAELMPDGGEDDVVLVVKVTE